ncbi:MAG: DNA mismatch repair protein MutS [Clostridia bacterium]|nr:DNA mismatch repair protein MutS [Clostridia bacterium]
MSKLSPMMQQYMSVKEQYQDTIILYRLGDFYEMFFDDAILASKVLEITLTGRDCGLEERAPMCGVPYHSVDSYIEKLITNGYKVAICEQMEDPATAKGIVKRDIVRIITPGTVIENNMLDEHKNNYIMMIYKQGMFYGISICDVSTGLLQSTSITKVGGTYTLIDEIAKYKPTEIIVNDMLIKDTDFITFLRNKFNVFISQYEKMTQDYFSKLNIEKESNIKDFELSKLATNILLSYVSNTQKNDLAHIDKISIYEIDSYMQLDNNARRNLEIVETIRDKSKKGTLLWVLDKTNTAMGSRMLRKWVDSPLINIKQIQLRQDALEEFKNNLISRGTLKDYFDKVYDIERLISKVVYGSINPRDLIALKNSLRYLPFIKQELSGYKSDMINTLYNDLDVLEDIYTLIEDSIIEDPPMQIKEGGIIKKGYNSELDEYILATTEGKKWIIELEQQEREKTGIKNLKVGYNRIFGYYFEVTKSNINMIPDRYIRKQTLANCERAITQELKEIETKILGAQEKIFDLEYNLFNEIKDKILKEILRLKQSSTVIANIDVLLSLAQIAEENNYVKPIINVGDIIDIKNGRHPVVEQTLQQGCFVANDTYLDTNENRFHIITGPNMAGKSTYMRQVALIVLMAQIGSFVPASSAIIGIADKIFTRVGSADDVAGGQSTFMVEMKEVADILNNATNRSLIILDEIGRGTSTFDGLAIAWATTEYICDKEKIGARTFFATHYHELTQLEDTLDGVKNYSVEVKDKGDDVIFLRKIISGGTSQSYGIHVAKLAGVPVQVIKNANKILKELADTDITKKEFKKGNTIQDLSQYDLFNYKVAEIAQEVSKLNIDELSPIEALNILQKFKDKLV